ncbi:MAG: hypothetical protein ACREUB_07380 [Burkholderiales bacterium]
MSQDESKSLAEPQRHGPDLADKSVKDSPAVRKWQVARRVMWMLLLAGAFLAYYLLDRLNEALSILK